MHSLGVSAVPKGRLKESKLPRSLTTPPAHLVLQLLRLSRAQFDMRCAEALSWDLEKLRDNISPRAYGLLAGVAVSYARPFKAGKGSPYGPLENKWAKFPERPDLEALPVCRDPSGHSELRPRCSLNVGGDVDEGEAVVEVPDGLWADLSCFCRRSTSLSVSGS